MSIAIVTATQCDGVILMFEKMFESRMFFVDKLISMGARIVLCDPHRAIVAGPSAPSAPMTSPTSAPAWPAAGRGLRRASAPSTTPDRGAASASMTAQRAGRADHRVPSGRPTPGEHDRKRVPAFLDKTRSVARRSCSNKKIERDDDSKKSHLALEEMGWHCADHHFYRWR
jgi:hypothetical protein